MTTTTSEYSECDEYGREIETHPRLSLAVTVVVLAVIMLVLLLAVDASDAAVQARPRGATERGWVVCWNKANHYEGQGSIMWDYAASECVEIVGE